jgi:hypothetical protein
MTTLYRCTVVAALAAVLGLAISSGALAKSSRPFMATTTTTFDQSGPVLGGTGNSTHLGNTAVSGTVSVDFSHFPFTVGVHYTLTLKAANGDEVYIAAATTLTDTASPPAGNNYSESGTYTVTGGTGRFDGATGSGAITGSCTSSFGNPQAVCTDSWVGTITY